METSTPSGGIQKIAGVRGMPDLDQLRANGTYLGQSVKGLPNTGRAYCAQAASANVLGWITLNGYENDTESYFPSLAPRASEWSPPSETASNAIKRAYVPVYNAQSEFMDELGREMGVVPFDESLGAGSGTPTESTVAVLNRRLPRGFKVKHISDVGCTFERRADGSVYDPDIGLNRIYNEIASGNLVLIHTAFYTEVTTPFGAKVWKYEGYPHLATVDGVAVPPSPATGVILTADSAEEIPLSGTDVRQFSQSVFGSTLGSIEDVPRSEERVVYQEAYSICSTYVKRATVIRDLADPSGAIIITGITVISPPDGHQFSGFLPTIYR